MGTMKFRTGALAALIGISLLAAGGNAESAVSDPHHSYIYNNFTGSQAEPPAAVTVWSSAMDVQADETAIGRGSAVTGGGKVYFIQQGQLLALNAQTGKRIWKYGAKLSAPLLYENGVIYASSQTGTIYAVTAATGKNQWSSSAPSKNPRQLLVDQGQLFAVNSDVQAYNLQTGKLQWKDNYTEPLWQAVQVQGELVLAEDTVSGAYSYDVLRAFDRKTGKQLWEADNYSMPVAADQGTLISQRTSNLLQMVALPTFDTLDARTGKVLGTAEYNPENINPDEALSSSGQAWISGNQLYINRGNTVYSYPADADPAKAAKTTYSAAGGGKDLMYAAGPYDGRILFSDGETVYGVKTANRQGVSYYGGASIARFDLLGHGMYIAKADGQLVAVNLLTGAQVLQLKTTGKAFGPTLLENGMILVQSKGKITAIKEPAALRMAK
ncbi:PQQ-binding-like beta-propeller repeat protein [Paenibacillus camerounensis]|uniref:PQQ-binding-like beta-propeller repeat protein n=1 Tax=Paenibacillus camerounensis TaxID=1243663 RepID=UPI0005A79B4A|nr:PQQ-binding-like beta-propeller repeat protein [Paenibacillus camerounensis]